MLQRSIAATIAASKGVGLASDCALKVRRRRHTEPLNVMLYPLCSDTLSCGGVVAMFIFDPTHASALDADLLRAFHGLTPAEARLACALAEGETVDSYCEAQRLTVNTVRTHLKHALSKTDTHRQAQLVSLVAKLNTVRRP
jgi:DNA-binding CsgD family transcriptional regulator